MAQNEKQSAGRAIISQLEAEAVTNKAGTSAVTRTKVGKGLTEKRGINRREFMAYATAGSLAVLTALGLGALVSPNKDDELLVALGGGEVIPGGFAYPRIKAGEFGGKFTIPRAPDSYTLTEAPELNSAGKFYIVKVASPPADFDQLDVAKKVATEAEAASNNGFIPSNDGLSGFTTNDGYVMAIYQVCTHLGCLIPFQTAQNRFICPCHGSTFERNSHYVIGPAPRNLDQFPITIENGVMVVDTGKKKTGKSHV